MEQPVQSTLDLTQKPLDIAHLQTYLKFAQESNHATLTRHMAVAINCAHLTNQETTLLITRTGKFIKTSKSLSTLIKHWTVNNSINDWPVYQAIAENRLIKHNLLGKDNRIAIYLSDDTYFMEIDSDYLLNINCIADYDLPDETIQKTSQTMVRTTNNLLITLPRGKKSLLNRLDRAHTLIFSTLSLYYRRSDENYNALFDFQLPSFMKRYFHHRELMALYIPKGVFIKDYQYYKSKGKSH